MCSSDLRDRTQTVTITDPENALDNVSVTTDKVACNGGPTQCLEITINHMFREPLDFDIVGTNVWDYSRQSWQNYYNHGIEVVGESLNPPKEFNGINKGHIYHLTETSKTTAVDEFGDSWTYQYGTWVKDFIKQERIQDGETQVFDRMHSDFAEYREQISNEALIQLSETCPLCIEQYADFEDSTSWEYGNKISKLSNPEIQMLMSVEEQKAQEIMKRLLDVKYDLRNAYLGIENDDRPIAEILEEERINKIILQAERNWLKQVIAPNHCRYGGVDIWSTEVLSADQGFAIDSEKYGTVISKQTFDAKLSREGKNSLIYNVAYLSMQSRINMAVFNANANMKFDFSDVKSALETP